MNLEFAQGQDVSWSEWTGLSDLPPIVGRMDLKPGFLRQSHFMTPEFGYWMTRLGEAPRFHSKQWQFLQIIDHALAVIGSPAQHRQARAIGFGVGQEPLPALFGALGCRVLATDWFEGPNASDWRSTGQLSAELAELNSRGVCDAAVFKREVSLVSMDMNDVPAELDGGFDVVWSTCALGHIGGYQAGLDFIERSLSLLRPGGVAIHTTEIDMSAELERVETPGLSLYRLHDVVSLLDRITMLGFDVPEHVLTPGYGVLERKVDRPPYSEPHLRIDVLGHEVLPFAVVARRPVFAAFPQAITTTALAG